MRYWSGETMTEIRSSLTPLNWSVERAGGQVELDALARALAAERAGERFRMQVLAAVEDVDPGLATRS